MDCFRILGHDSNRIIALRNHNRNGSPAATRKGDARMKYWQLISGMIRKRGWRAH
jgi:hypothetical protein